MKPLRHAHLLSLLIIGFALSTPAVAAPPLVPGLGVPGDFELGVPLDWQLDDFFRRHPTVRPEVRDERGYLSIGYGLFFRVGPDKTLNLIVCRNPDFAVEGLGLRVGDDYRHLAKRLGQPDRPNLQHPRNGLGRVWYYDFEGIGFDVGTNGQIAAILIYPRKF